jgi:hypothetical protein
VGSATRRGEDHPVGFEALPERFLHCKGIAESAGRAGSAVRYEIGQTACGPGLLEGCLKHEFAICAVGDHYDLCPEQYIKEVIPGRFLRFRCIKHEDAAEAEPGGRGGGLPAVVRLQGSSGHKGLPALGQGLRDEELKLAGLVAAERESGLVVALHEQFWPAQMG